MKALKYLDCFQFILMKRLFIVLLLLVSLPAAFADAGDMMGQMMGFTDFNSTGFGQSMMWGMWNPLMIVGVLFYFGVGSFIFSYIFWWTRSLFDKKGRRR